MRELTRENILDILYGCAILGTGGGGTLEDGINHIEEAFSFGKKFILADFDEVDPEAMIGTPYFCGAISPLTEEEEKKFGNLPETEKYPALLALEAVEKYLGKDIPLMISTELGAENTSIAFYTAAMPDRVILDGDPAGRSVPALQHSTYYLDDIPMYPLGACTDFGEAMVISYLPSDMRGEDILRAIAAVSRNSVAIVDHIASAKDIGASVIRGAITRAEKIGRAFREAVKSGSDLGGTVSEAAGGKRIFRGVIRENSYETRDGYTFGDMYIKGEGEFEGHELHIWYQNENIMSYLDGEVFVTVPELVVVLDLDNKMPQMNPYARAGEHVDVLCLPADMPWMTEKGLACFGPKSFGFEKEWEPYLEY